MCLTATATPSVHKDIIANMRLKNPVEAEGSFDRPNLSYTVLRKRGRAADMATLFAKGKAKSGGAGTAKVNVKTLAGNNQEKMTTGSVKKSAYFNNNNGNNNNEQRQQSVSPATSIDAGSGSGLGSDTSAEFKKPPRSNNPNANGMTVVYCNTKKETEGVAACIRKLGTNAIAYHAGLSPALRKSTHDDFVYDRMPVIVATTAFGMGIDKPDVRRVIHYGAPKSLETYYQQTGRAGRDGSPSECIMFWSDGDFATNTRLIEMSANTAASTSTEVATRKSSSSSSSLQLNHNLALLAKMKEYTLAFSVCRRRLLLEYFGETPAKPRCGNCDNCRKSPATHLQLAKGRDCAADACRLLTAVEMTNGRYGLGLPVDVLMGSSRKQVVEHHFEDLSCHGAGRKGNKTAEWWKCFGRMLIEHGLLREESRSSFVRSCALSDEGQDFCASIASTMLAPYCLRHRRRCSTWKRQAPKRRAKKTRTRTATMTAATTARKAPLKSALHRPQVCQRSGRRLNEACTQHWAHCVCVWRVEKCPA